MQPKPSAAVIDPGLPDGNGALVLCRIRRDYGKQVPVAVVTGQPDPQFVPHLVREPPEPCSKSRSTSGAGDLPQVGYVTEAAVGGEGQRV